jgi:hypothetical protein
VAKGDRSLRLYAETGSRAGFAVHAVTTAGWSERAITYANAPTPGPVAAVSGPVAAESWASIELTNLARGASMVAVALTGEDNARACMRAGRRARPRPSWWW